MRIQPRQQGRPGGAAAPGIVELGEAEPLRGEGVRRLAAQVEVGELAAGVLDVVEDADGGIVAPAESLEGLAPLGAALVVGDGGGILRQQALDPLLHAHQGLGLVPGVAEDLEELTARFESGDPA